MKVLAINGSPRKGGNTAHALKAMEEELAAAGIEMETVQVGGKIIRGCMACGACARNKDERCAFGDTDPVNETVQKVKAADGLILATPVHFAGIGGTMKSLLDRVFYVDRVNGGLFAGKVGASVVAVRRTGGSMAWQSLNFYLTFAGMPIAGSTYWSIVHGTAPGDVAGDAEGLQTVRNAARNMAWMLAQRAATPGLALSEFDRGAQTNFIR
ncbi:MAG: flavodoxin family protein [Alistipes sp.]|jgi:multimeric flavodoxin WrbA|nr:flavodoxin family protein [Alistipes sp.]